MGQAKNRKAEINELKKNGKGRLETFGAFYKDDTDEGVSIVLTRKDMPTLEKVVDTIAQSVKSEVNDYTVSNDEVLEQLKEAILEYNQWCWGTTVRPQKMMGGQKAVDSEFMKLAIVIISDIMLLVERKVIKNDEFNGLLYLHAN